MVFVLKVQNYPVLVLWYQRGSGFGRSGGDGHLSDLIWTDAPVCPMLSSETLSDREKRLLQCQGLFYHMLFRMGPER